MDIRCSYSRDPEGRILLDLAGNGSLTRVNEPGPVIEDGDGELYVLSLGDEEIGAFVKPLAKHPELVPHHLDDPRVVAQLEAGILYV